MKESLSSQMLELLKSKSDSWFSAATLAGLLGVSTRQIRKYVAAVNNGLSVPVILSSDKGYQLCQKAYRNYQLTKRQRVDTPSARQNYLLQELLINEELLIYDVADTLYVSMTTIENDLRLLKEKLKVISLDLVRSQNTVRIYGEETDKRKLMSQLISQAIGNHFVFNEEIDLLTFHYQIWGFRSAIRNIFDECGIFTNDYALNVITLHLIIMIDRVRSGHPLQEHVDLKKVETQPGYQAAVAIAAYLFREFNKELNAAERYHLTLVITNNTTQIDHEKINAQNIQNFIEQRYIEQAQKAVKQVEDHYCLEPFSEDFIAKFAIHIQNLFFRAEHHYQINNPLTDEIKLSYPLIYDISVSIAQYLSKTAQLEINEHEIAYIALHIGSYFESNGKGKMKVSCCFVYADYYAQYIQIINKIRSQFDDQLIIQSAVSINDFDPSRHPAELTLSMTELPGVPDALVLHPFLTAGDMIALSDRLDKMIKQKQGELLKSQLMEFFDARLFYNAVPKMPKAELLKRMCKDLEHLGYGSSHFYTEVMAREKMSSTAYNLVAIPHTLSKDIQHNFIFIAINEAGMKWDSKTVYIVALLGISEKSRRLFSEIFDQLVEIFSESQAIMDLAASKDFKQFIHKLCLKMNHGMEE